MSISSIGIQSILPKTGTSQSPQQQAPANDNEADDMAAEAAIADAVAHQAPPPPGMGKLIDKSV